MKNSGDYVVDKQWRIDVKKILNNKLVLKYNNNHIKNDTIGDYNDK